MSQGDKDFLKWLGATVVMLLICYMAIRVIQ